MPGLAGAPVPADPHRRTSADGHFDLANVAPGSYVLSAHATLPQPPGSAAPLDALAASTDVDVAGEDVGDVALVLGNAITVSGAFRYEGDGPPPNLTLFRVGLAPVQQTTLTITSGSATTAPDGTFKLSAVTPGRYRLTVGLPSPTAVWSLRAATGQRLDPLDIPIDLRQSISDIVITVSDRVSELKGRVDSAAGGSTDYSIILFSTDRAYWMPSSRRIQSARTASDGAYTFRNVPPGQYHLAAVDDVEPGEWFDASFLQRLLAGAMTITIEQGEKKVQDIRVGGG